MLMIFFCKVMVWKCHVGPIDLTLTTYLQHFCNRTAAQVMCPLLAVYKPTTYPLFHYNFVNLAN